MSFYIRPLFSKHHTKGALVKKLGSSNLKFSMIEILSRENNKFSKKIISLTDVDNFTNKEKKIIKYQLKNIQKKRKSISGLKFDQPTIMGILNITPDSFSDGGKYASLSDAKNQFDKMVNQGANVIDIGGESTRPGAKSVSSQNEIKRLTPILKFLKKNKNKIPVSVDTRKPEVMLSAIQYGSDIINDVSGLRYSKKSIPLLSKEKKPIIIMHSISTPKLMQNKINYKNIMLDVYDFLEKKIMECEKLNIDRSKIIIDPGIGFGKNVKQNLKLIENIALFHSLGVPILIGSSRKSFISKIIKNALVDNRIGGSLSSVIYCLSQGVQIFRVHDIFETIEAISIYRNISKI